LSQSVLALGANLGDPLAALQAAVDALGGAGKVLAVSGVYQTAPVGGPPQPDYLNAVLLLETALTPTELLAFAHAVESGAGRERQERWGPRTLDIDVIAYDDLVSADPSLTLPHPRAHERGFVLVPWAEIASDAALPGHGRIVDLLDKVDTSDVRRLDDVALSLPGVS
jgi:2-amino-4-hydroxy-6-hydroxymethyldihydropteridine diphosphokinase